MKTAVMTDSNSGITKTEAESMGIFVIPMPVIIDDETRYENEDISEEEFYAALTGGKNITTSLPSPGLVMDMWHEILDKGYEEIIYLPMSSGLSNSCSVATALADDFDGNVCVADNHRISVSLRDAVIVAQQMAADGASAQEIKEQMEKDAYNSTIYVAVDTLEFLKKSGRVTAAGAALGAVLNIKPILTIQGGKLDAYTKVRGRKKCMSKIIEALKDDMKNRFADADMSQIRIGAAGANLTPEEAGEWVSVLKEAFPEVDVYYNALSFSITAHTGPGALGVGLTIVK